MEDLDSVKKPKATLVRPASTVGGRRSLRAGRIAGLTKTYLPPAIGLLLVVLVWELWMGVFDVPTFLLAAPSEIVQEMVAHPGLLADHAFVTLQESVLGFLVGSAAGIMIAVVIVHSATFSRVVMPWLISSQVMPKIAIAPLLLLWFGFGLTGKVVIAALMAIFPVVVAHAQGMRSVPQDLLDLARSMQGNRWRVFTKLRFPYSLPTLFAGLKVGATLAVIGAVVGEFVGGSEGLGFLIVTSNYNFNIERMFASLILLMIIGVLIYGAVVLLEYFVLRNRRQMEVIVIG